MLRLVSSTLPAIEMQRESVVLGRDSSADQIVNDRSVSRRHARIYKSGNAWLVEDLGSGNGTWVDGARVTTAPLANGQELRLGTVPFKVEMEGAVAETLLVPALAASAPPPIPAGPPSYAPPPPTYAPQTDPSQGYAQQGYPPQGYAPAAAAPAHGGGLGKLLVLGLALYFGYDYLQGRQASQGGAAPAEQGGAAPAEQGDTAPPAAGGGTAAGVRIQSVKVDKSRENGGTKVLVRTIVDGFGARKAQGGYQVSVVQDVETLAPDGSRIDGLSKESVNVLEKVMENNEGLSATFDFSFSLQAGAEGTLTTKMKIRDQIGGGEVTRDVKIKIP